MFLSGVRNWSNLIFLHVIIHFSPHHLLKLLFAPLSNTSWLYMQGFISLLSSVPLAYVFILIPVPYYYNQYSFVV